MKCEEDDFDGRRSKHVRRDLYSFPRTAMKNIPWQGGLRCHKLLLSQFRKRKSEIKMSAGLDPSGRPKGLSALPVFQLLVVAGSSGNSLTCRLIIPIFVFVFTWCSSPWVSLCLHDLVIRTPSTGFQFSSVQSLSHVRLCDPMNHSTPGLSIHHQLLEFTQTHVHRVSDAIQPSHPLSSPSPPAPNPSQHQSLFQ